MLSDEKILITGPAGSIAFDIARDLVVDNEVWGIARFGDADQRDEVEALGVTTRVVDLGVADFSALPSDFSYVLHLAVSYTRDDYDRALTVNAEGTGLLLEHCRRAKAALVMSTNGVYKPHPDPWHVSREGDPLGDMLAAHSAPYSVSKISQEAVARYCARSLGLPVVIARMNAAYGPRGGLPVSHLHLVASGEPVPTRFDPCPYSPIHIADIVDQVEPLLDAATVPATIVNWCGDDSVSVQEWTELFGALLDVPARVAVTEIPGASRGNVAAADRRRSITGPCRFGWKEGFRMTVEHFYPERVVEGDA